MEERERGEGHSGGQICIIRQMNMSHERLKQTHGSFSTSVCVYSFNKKTDLMFYTYNENCCDGNSCVHEYCEDKKKGLFAQNEHVSFFSFIYPCVHELSRDRKIPSNFPVQYTALHPS